jgi:hypothetical protein
MINMVSHLVEVVRVTNKTSTHVVLHLENAWLARCAKPVNVIRDQGILAARKQKRFHSNGDTQLEEGRNSSYYLTVSTLTQIDNYLIINFRVLGVESRVRSNQRMRKQIRRRVRRRIQIRGKIQIRDGELGRLSWPQYELYEIMVEDSDSSSPEEEKDESTKSEQGKILHF